LKPPFRHDGEPLVNFYLERAKIQAALRDIVGPAPPAEVRIGGRSAELDDRARVAA
jgi:hypothetical protein